MLCTLSMKDKGTKFKPESVNFNLLTTAAKSAAMSLVYTEKTRSRNPIRQKKWTKKQGKGIVRRRQCHFQVFHYKCFRQRGVPFEIKRALLPGGGCVGVAAQALCSAPQKKYPMFSAIHYSHGGCINSCGLLNLL